MASSEEDIHVNPVMHLIAPITAIAATAIVRKAINVGYEKATGHPAPEPRDPRVRFTTALTWAVVTAVTAAVVEVAIYRATNEIGSKVLK